MLLSYTRGSARRYTRELCTTLHSTYLAGNAIGLHLQHACMDTGLKVKAERAHGHHQGVVRCATFPAGFRSSERARAYVAAHHSSSLSRSAPLLPRPAKCKVREKIWNEVEKRETPYKGFL